MNKSATSNNVIITESPRDGMQGLKTFIPTQTKADYIKNLLNVGFDIIDFGSFVSAKSISQLRDTSEVLEKLNLSSSKSFLMVLVANMKGAELAVNYDKISYISFPFSVSPTFLKLNINSDFEQALSTIDKINNLCIKKNKKLKVYLTMAFGNPYGDECNADIILNWVNIINNLGIKFITLSDVTGVSSIKSINDAYSQLITNFSSIEFGLHLHTKPGEWYDKLDVAYKSGCRSFDAVINGMGGCPMTNYEMVGNLDTGNLLSYFEEKQIKYKIDINAFKKAVTKSKKIFN